VNFATIFSWFRLFMKVAATVEPIAVAASSAIKSGDSDQHKAMVALDALNKTTEAIAPHVAEFEAATK